MAVKLDKIVQVFSCMTIHILHILCHVCVVIQLYTTLNAYLRTPKVEDAETKLNRNICVSWH